MNIAKYAALLAPPSGPPSQRRLPLPGLRGPFAQRGATSGQEATDSGAHPLRGNRTAVGSQTSRAQRLRINTRAQKV